MIDKIRGHKEEPHDKFDIFMNPENPGKSRIPVDTSLPAIERFIKQEIIVTKTCCCPKCMYRRIMFRAIQDILKCYRNMVMEKCPCMKKK